jgi:signal transduction histidine kinase
MQARLGEHVGLAHGPHDGLGGMLIGNIAVLEQVPDRAIPSREVVGMRKELRDDLRVIIDTASAQQHGEHSPGELLGPLRDRMARLFEAHDVSMGRRLEGLNAVLLDTTRSLDLLLVLQEALTNALKHSGARRVDVSMTGANGTLPLEMRDNGRGFARAAGPAGQRPAQHAGARAAVERRARRRVAVRRCRDPFAHGARGAGGLHR